MKPVEESYRNSGGSRIFLTWGRQLPNCVILQFFFAENCMKMKEFGRGRGGIPGTSLGSANVKFVLFKRVFLTLHLEIEIPAPD